MKALNHYLNGRELAVSFEPDPDNRFAAVYAAERWAEDHGFAVGPMQRAEYRAMMWPREEYIVAKWKNLNERERRESHALMAFPASSGGRVEIWEGSATRPLGSKT